MDQAQTELLHAAAPGIDELMNVLLFATAVDPNIVVEFISSPFVRYIRTRIEHHRNFFALYHAKFGEMPAMQDYAESELGDDEQDDAQDLEVEEELRRLRESPARVMNAWRRRMRATISSLHLFV